MRFLLVSLLLVAIGSCQALQSVPSIIRERGYPVESHEVITADGYILTAHRIPYGKTKPGRIGRPVILQHGIMCSSVCWILPRSDKALAYILADRGYDVWLTNTRGNTYGKNHKTLPNDTPAFWDFSFHEMGYYDIPAFVDHILSVTNQTKLHYVGHSMGTTMFFLMMASRPEYNEKVVHMSALAPIVFLEHTRGTVKNLISVAWYLEAMAKITGTYEFMSDSEFEYWMVKELCSVVHATELICENLLFLVAGYDSQQWNMTLLPAISEYMPESFSTKMIVHYAQIAKNGGKFTWYDYGILANLRKYKLLKPPEYPLSRVTVPVSLHYSHNDWLAGVEDVMKLKDKMVASSADIVPFYYFNHLDHMWAVDVVDLLYNQVIDIMSKY